MRIDNLAQLRDDLLNFRLDFEAADVRKQLLPTTWPRLLPTLEIIPDSLRNGSILELGSIPFFLTLCLRRLCTGPLTLGNYFGQAETKGARQLINEKTGETLDLAFDLFNIETDDFPYPDGSFDLVIFAELIEHLAVNPVQALSEMHRVLKPDGVLIVTTPNSISTERLESFLVGSDRMVDRYSPSCGYGARHNREYHPQELRDLLEGTGFVIETLTVRDIMPIRRVHQWHRAVWRQLLRLYSPHSRNEHIFLRARRRDPFRWRFPATLFDNIESYALVRYPWMEMGINDTIQCVDGWHPLQDRAEARGAIRWTRRTGQVFLKTPTHPQKVCIECFAHAAPDAPPLPVRVTVWDRWLGRVDPQCVYVDAPITVGRGRRQRVELPLQATYMHPGNAVEVRFEIAAEVIGARELAALPEGERGLAVHKVWLE